MAEINDLQNFLEFCPEAIIDDAFVQQVQDKLGYYTRFDFQGKIYAVSSTEDRQALINEIHNLKQKEYHEH